MLFMVIEYQPSVDGWKIMLLSYVLRSYDVTQGTVSHLPYPAISGLVFSL